MVLGAFLLVDFEPKYSGNVHIGRLLWHEVWVSLQKNVGKRAPEVGSVYIGAPLLGNVHIFTQRAVDLHPGVFEVLAHSDWQHRLAVAEDSRTRAEVVAYELLPHHRESCLRRAYLWE